MSAEGIQVVFVFWLCDQREESGDDCCGQEGFLIAEPACMSERRREWLLRGLKIGKSETVTTFQEISDIVGTGLLQDRFLTLIQAVVVIVTPQIHGSGSCS